MITVDVYRNAKKRVCGFSVKNHGDNRVCAAVSILVLNTVNSIEAFTAERMVCEYEESGGYIKAEFPDIRSGGGTDGAVLLLDAMMLGLTGIQAEYARHIEINEPAAVV